MQDEQLLSLNDAATRKGLPPNDLQKAIEAGELPAVQRGNAHFLHPEALEQWQPHVKTAAGADFNQAEADDYLRTEDTPS